MIRGSTAAIALLALAATANAQTPPTSAAVAAPVRVHGPAAAAEEIVAAERAFNARSIAVGPARAMRDYMDAVDGLSFAGGEPARGGDAIYKAHGGDTPAGSLTWTPDEVFAAKAGDMGASWGHFRFLPPGAGGKTVTGRYVTVWRKNAGGEWKGILDIGTPD